MNENRLTNILLGGMVILTVAMFSWTFMYINHVALNTTNIQVVSAFDA